MLPGALLALLVLGAGCGRSSLYELDEGDLGAPVDLRFLPSASDALVPPDAALGPADLALADLVPPVDLAPPVDLPAPSPDLSEPIDLAVLPGVDLSLSPAPDLAQPVDQATPPPDLAQAPDLVAPLPDLSRSPDLSPPPDLAPLADLRPPLDLAPPPDLVVPPDLAVSPLGCADGTREGFTDGVKYRDIASCAGGFAIPGVLSATRNPACNRGGGNSGANPTGAGCNVEDLCAAGWHVCIDAADVMAHSPTGCVGAAPGAADFFVTRQSSTGCGVCATGNNLADPPCNSVSCAAGCKQTDAIANDVFGCGSTGTAPDPSCGVLDRFGNNLCASLPPSWSCGNDGVAEAKNVVHAAAGGGGALCCRD